VTCPHAAKTPRTAAANHARVSFAAGGPVTRRARNGIERVPPTCATNDSTAAASRVRLATMPALTGSVPPAKMIGIVDVAALLPVSQRRRPLRRSLPPDGGPIPPLGPAVDRSDRPPIGWRRADYALLHNRFR